MMLKFGQDVALRGTKKLELFFPKKCVIAGYTLSLYEKSQFLQKKTQILRIKKCVVPRRQTFSGKNNSRFFIHLRATS